jgi:hypothetical protein
MGRTRYKTASASKLLAFCIFFAVFASVLSFVLTGLRQANAASDTEGLRIAEESIRRSAINCYAIEGSYPPDFDYLKEHYGISVDERKYNVYYEIFASNIMPVITVIQIEK